MKFTVCAHTAYPLTSDVKPEIYNAGVPKEVEAANAHEAARIAVEIREREFEASGTHSTPGTYHYAVIGHDNYSFGPTVEIVEVTIEARTVRVTGVETVQAERS